MGLLPYFIFGCVAVLYGSFSQAQTLADLKENTQHELQTFLYRFSHNVPNASLDPNRWQSITAIETSSGVEVGDDSYLNLEVLTYLHSMEDNHHDSLHTFERRNRYAAVFSPKVVSLVYESDDFDFTAGLDLVDFGYAELHNSVSNLGRSNSLHSTHSFELGVPLASYRRYIGDDTLSYTLMPIEMASLVPELSNRWKGDGSGSYPSLPDGSSVSEIETTPLSIQPKNIRHLMLYEATRSSFDYYGFGFFGPSPFSIVRQNNLTYEKHNPWSWQLGGGVNKVSGAQKYYFDMMYQSSPNRIDENFVRGTIGGIFKNSSWSKDFGINEIILTTEYARDVRTRDQSDRSDLIFSSKKSRSGLNTLLAKIELDIDDEWTVFSVFTQNLTGNDHSEALGVRFKVNDSLKYYGNATFFDGKAGTPIGSQRANDVFEVGLKWSF